METSEHDRILNTMTNFMTWKDSLHYEKRGDEIMFDVRGNYKWMKESELFEYYMDFC